MKLYETRPWRDNQAAVTAMLEETERSRQRWGAYRSGHEAYGVLAEEILELLDALHQGNEVGARLEAMQVAAVAFRLARDGWSRSGTECHDSGS